MLLVSGSIWLYDHPEYYYLDLSQIHETENGPIHITMNIDGVTISEPPPVYYLYLTLMKIRPFMFWGGIIALIIYCYGNRKNIRKIAKKINEALDE